MDPIAALADFLTATDTATQMDAASALRTWYYKGGFKPLVTHVRGEVEKRGFRWTARRHALAILGGAV